MKQLDLTTLNPVQKQAVLSSDRALLILAGAGSGKTKVLTSKIAYRILEEGLAPSSVLAFTFTNKAAGEMKERVSRLLARPVDGLWIGTFHSICARLLRRDIDRLGYTSRFTIYDSQDQKTLMKHVMKDVGGQPEGMSPSAVLNKISSFKNQGLDWEEAEKQAQFGLDPFIVRCFKRYEREKKKNNSLDFDDLIGKTLELFRSFPEIRDRYRKQFQAIFVDEYQDTNEAQYRLILALTGRDARICVVGDADQSIYGWRGAEIKNILNFEQDFSGAKTLLLEQNYRSTKNILNAANELIHHNQERKDKNLWTENETGSPVSFHSFSGDREEAMQVVAWMEEEQAQGSSYGDMAVLYRTNAQSRSYEEALLREGIPYKIVGGLKFYDRAEIKDLVAYLNLLVNPTDDVAFLRIINQPKRGIGQATLTDLQRICADFGLSLMDGLEEEEVLHQLTNAQRKKLGPFTELFHHLQSYLSKPLTDLGEEVYEASGYREMLETSHAVEDQSRMENIRSFLDALAQFQEDNPEAGLVDYLEDLSLMSDLDKTKQEEDGVRLMTIHSAKGLEFPIVFLGGLEEGLFPSRMTMDEGNLEEERRLMYVAMTRAEKKLYLTRAENRMLYGRTMPQLPSRFIEELGSTIEKSRDDTGERWQESESTLYRQKEPVYRKGMSDPALRQRYDRQRNEFKRMIQEKKKRIEEGKKTPYRVGDKVKHKKFGPGTIVAVTAHPEGDELTVAFDKKGLKRLNAALAPLTKLK